MASRRRSPLEQEGINQAVEEMLQKGIISPSHSEWVSEPHLVRKEDGSFQFCKDFRPRNRLTKHDRYPLPRIDDLLDQLGKSRYFTSLDLASGYWQIPMNPKDAHKTAFRTSRGLFQFNCMFFELSDAGITFQHMANNIFQDFITAGVVIVYRDDILIHTSTWQEHISLLQNVKQRIQDNNLQLQLKKCHWGCTKLKVLAYIISSAGIEMDPAKIQSIHNPRQSRLFRVSSDSEIFLCGSSHT